ncbi:MAG: hypothetical protein PVH00_08925, partial [Gemmatimonadota bacterium]
LEGAAGSLAVPDFADPLAAVEDALRDDVLRAGSFMLREAERQAPAQEARADRDAAIAAAAWSAWHRQAVARLRLDIAAADFRDTLIRRRTDLASALENGLADPIDEWLADTARALGELRSAVERSCTSTRANGDASALREQLRSVEEQACEILRREGPHDLAARDMEQVSRKAAVACIDGVLEAVRGTEAMVTLHERPIAGEPVQPSKRTARVRVREMAEQAFDVVLLERIRTSTRAADEAFAAVLAESRGLEDVIRFNLGAALDEIDAEGPAETRLEGAEELALNGLDRSVSALTAMRGRVHEAVDEAERAARQAFQSGWDRFHDRVRVEDRVQDQLLDLGYRVRFALREAGIRARRGLERFAKDAAARLRIGHRHALQLLRLGQAVVEGGRVSVEERRATVDALTSIGAVLAGLPLVYRRLFALQPVEDPALLVGRTPDLDAVRQHFEHWRMGITDALVITGGSGSGRTSLLNVVRETILDGTTVHSVTLRERCTDEAGFIRRLEPGLPAGCAGVTTFAALADALRNVEPDGSPRVIIIEGLEHALLRTASGNGLLGRVFSLMSATDSNIFWLGTMVRAAWDYIERTDPLTPGLVRHYPLSALTREPAEEIVMRRHARSGLPIVFESPATPAPVLKRRLRRARNEAHRQAVLRTEFFDRLHRAAGQNVTLALFYWLRSASVDPGTGALHARALEPLNFGFLDELSLPQSFALKAFLDHGSLSLDEYEVILGASHDDAREMFESLGNQLLIEPTAQDNALADFRFNTIADGLRYRIRPLVMHPVTSHLHGRNLLLSDN